MFRPGDIVYSKIRPYLRKSILVNFEGICSADMYPLTARPGLDAGYLNALILSDGFTTQAVAQQDRTGIPKLNREQLNSILVPKPPLAEQRRIAAVVSTVQTALGMQDRIVTTLKELKAATLAKLFREGLRGAPLKQTEIGEIPESWVVGRLGDHCEKPQYGYTESARNEPIGPKFLRITDISEYGVDWNSVPYCPCTSEALRTLRLKPGDLVFARIGATTGKSYLITECPEAVFASYLIRVRAKEGLDPAFLSCFFETSAYWRQIRANDGANVKGGMNASVLTSLRCPVPLLEEQEEIAAILRKVESRLAHAARERLKLRALFESTLHLLMTGQVRASGDVIGQDDRLLARSNALERQRRALSEETLQEIVRRIVESVQPERIILFGSAARGEMGPDSDVDLLIVKSGVHRRELAARLYRELGNLPVPKDIIVATPEDLERHRDTIGLVYRTALREGRVVYAAT